MAQKFYAVKKGTKTGIFHTWEECKKHTQGIPGAEFKSFRTKAEAEDYLGPQSRFNVCNNQKNSDDWDSAVAYVDGSYDSETGAYSYGVVFIIEKEEIHLSGKMADEEMASMHNVAGEIQGAIAAFQYALEHEVSRLRIYHDYEGIAKWCTGEWTAKKDATKAYRETYYKIKEKIEISFEKVKAHSGNKYNEIADALAKKALGLDAKTALQKQDLDRNNKIYIVRDVDKLQQLLDETVKLLWCNATTEKLADMGLQKRYTFAVDAKNALLDIYQKNDGTTTLVATGKHSELSQKLKNAVETKAYADVSEPKSYSMLVGEEWIAKTVAYLKHICVTDGVGRYEKIPEKGKLRHVFISEIGDKLTLTEFDNGNLLIQGKPLFLYNEFLSFVSYSPKVEMNDIIQATKEFGVVSVCSVDAARNKLQELMPRAYTSNIDETVWKVFSPAMALMNFEAQMEDYSYCVFPALRALEGYLKYLLAEKGITVDMKQNFSVVFESDPSNPSQKRVKPKMATQIADHTYEKAMLAIYEYLAKNRNVIFHMEQILIATRLIEDREEARTTVYEVAELIERTYKNTHP